MKKIKKNKKIITKEVKENVQLPVGLAENSWIVSDCEVTHQQKKIQFEGLSGVMNTTQSFIKYEVNSKI